MLVKNIYTTIIFFSIFANSFKLHTFKDTTNNKIKMIKRKAYGFRDEKYFELILLGLYDKTNAIMR